MQQLLPTERFVYLGDTARLPYGTKSAETVVRYALQAAEALLGFDLKALVVACNTASAAALPALRERYPEMPLLGVVEPGARAASQATRTGHVLVLATEGTVRGGAYQRAIAAARAGIRVSALACPLLVSLAEEGWHEGEVAEAAVRRYLQPYLQPGDGGPDTLLLGCTHFPMLRTTLARVGGARWALIDSAATTAAAVRDMLLERGLCAGAVPLPPAESVRFLATDGASRFARVGGHFLGRTLGEDQVEVIDL